MPLHDHDTSSVMIVSACAPGQSVLKLIVSEIPDLSLITMAETLIDAVTLASSLNPDIVLTDGSIPELQESETHGRLLILNVFREPDRLLEATDGWTFEHRYNPQADEFVTSVISPDAGRVT